MKRAIFVVVGVVLLVIAAGWGYLAYRQYKSYQTLIPRAATTIVRIQIDALAKAIAWNALWNGNYYGNSSGRQSVGFNRNAWNQTGIAAPANVFLYQFDHPQSAAFPNIFFGSLPLADAAAFVEWAGKRLKMEVQRDALGSVALSERAIIIIGARQILFAISPTKPAKSMSLLTEQLRALLQPSESVPISKSCFAEMQSLDGHLRIFGKHHASADFKKGEILFTIRHEPASDPAAEMNAPHFADSNTISLWLQEPLTDLLKGRQFDIGHHSLHGDSLLNHYRGHIVMEWRGSVIQHDTVIRYDYNENFEMIERRQIVERHVPEIYLSVLADSALNRYLQEQGVFNATGDAVSRDVLPLFHISVNPMVNGYVQLYTGHDADEPPKPGHHGAHNRLQLRINFSNMAIHEIAPLAAPYIQAFDRLEAATQPIDDKEAAIRGKLIMKNQQVNSLAQLLMSTDEEGPPPGL